MIAAGLFYLGSLLAVAALASLGLTRLARVRRGRRAAAVLAISGIGLALAGLTMPSRDVVVGQARERIDAAMPRYQFRERHSLAIAASPLDVYRAVHTVTADEIRFYRALTWLRRLGRRGPESMLNAPRDTPILALATRTGFNLLVDDPAGEIVLGATGPVSNAARAATRPGTRRPFAAAADGYLSIAMNFSITSDGHGGSVLATETRVFAPDAPTRRRLAAYWRVIHPGSSLIRRGWLAAIRRRAESSTTPFAGRRETHALQESSTK